MISSFVALNHWLSSMHLPMIGKVFYEWNCKWWNQVKAPPVGGMIPAHLPHLADQLIRPSPFPEQVLVRYLSCSESNDWNSIQFIISQCSDTKKIIDIHFFWGKKRNILGKEMLPKFQLSNEKVTCPLSMQGIADPPPSQHVRPKMAIFPAIIP